MSYFDLAIVGAGWAGFNAALEAGKHGLDIALIESKLLGGTCLNQGCIPTKTLIQSAKIYSLSKKATQFGIENKTEAAFNLQKIQDRKNKIILQLRLAMQSMLKNKNIEYINGEARFIAHNALSVEAKSVKAKFYLIATGSQPQELNFLKFDGKKIISSNHALKLEQLPSNIAIVGGGVIGCEFASFFNLLGSRVRILELMPQLLPQEDPEVSKRLQGIFKKRGIEVNTACNAHNVVFKDNEVIMVCAGRTADIQNLGLDEAGVNVENGNIITDDFLRTNIDNIYAAGDCLGRIMLAHLAADQGKKVVLNILYPERARKIDNPAIPNCIFTSPDIASVGLNEIQAQKMGIDIRIDRFDFAGSAMARIIDETEGFLKIVSDKISQRVLGASIIGPGAVELIGILTLAIQSGLSRAQLSSTLFAHPTLSESITESMRA